MSRHVNIYSLLSLAIILNISFILLSYMYLEDDVPDRPGIVIPLAYPFHDMDNKVDSIDKENEQTEFLDSPSNMNNNHIQSSKVTTIWLAGIIIDILKIQPSIWDSIINLNCKHHIGIHIITKNNLETGKKKRDELYKFHSFEEKNCAPFQIANQAHSSIAQNTANDKKDNRIDRISHLRDYQRNLLKEKFFDDDLGLNDGVIILADLDLFKLPTVEMIQNQTQKMRSESYPFDAVCAIGTKVNLSIQGEDQKRKIIPFYYDTYATVFLPDTYSHPLSRRLIPRLYQGEDPTMVRSNDQLNGNFTQADIWKHFVQKGKQEKTGDVPVRSCFGGLTFYRSSVYFKMGCQYTLDQNIINKLQNDHTSIMRYASNKEQRPCEHVVLHDCLANNIATFEIAVNPNLITIWNRNT